MRNTMYEDLFEDILWKFNIRYCVDYDDSEYFINSKDGYTKTLPIPETAAEFTNAVSTIIKWIKEELV